MIVSARNATPPNSTKSRKSDVLVSRGTNSKWDFGLIWICTQKIEFYDSVNVRRFCILREICHTHDFRRVEFEEVWTRRCDAHTKKKLRGGTHTKTRRGFAHKKQLVGVLQSKQKGQKVKCNAHDQKLEGVSYKRDVSPKNGDIALWLPTNSLMCSKCVSQKWNERRCIAQKRPIYRDLWSVMHA